jgi:transcriptional regulator with XRE-family HTH domain
MDPQTLCNDLRTFLNSGSVTIAEVERRTSLNRSWLSKFRRGVLSNPTVSQLQELHRFRVEQEKGA